MINWKEINGYEKLYHISNNGKIKSKHRKGSYGKEIKQWVDKKGYSNVRLCKNGKCKNFKVHRLVAKAFIPNPNDYSCINHKDENKLNNNESNLEWCSYEYNNNYGTKRERISKTKSKPVLCIELNVTYYGIREAERKTGISQGNISQCCNGKRQKAGNYHWKYVEKNILGKNKKDIVV